MTPALAMWMEQHLRTGKPRLSWCKCFRCAAALVLLLSACGPKAGVVPACLPSCKTPPGVIVP